MIHNQKIEVTISNNAKFYQHLFDEKLKQGMKILVDVQYLPTKTGKEVLCTCDVCGINFRRSLQLLNRQSIHHCYDCARKHVGKQNLGNKNGWPSFIGEKHPRYNPKLAEYKRYSNKVRWLSSKNDLSLLKDFDKPRTVCGILGGYQLDHIKSIKFGFDNNLPVTELSNITNLRFISWEDNRAKWYH